jgi:hypothetical protein
MNSSFHPLKPAGLSSAALASLLAMGLFPTSSSAAQPLVPATTYECTGTDLSILFDADSEFGKDVPAVVIGLGKEQIRARGERVSLQRTVLGTLVTVRHGAAVPDSHVDSLTFVAPDVNVPVASQGPTRRLRSSFFKTRTLTGIGGPQFVEGAIQQSSEQPIACRASNVKISR